MIESDVELTFVEPSDRHIREVGQGVRIDDVGLRIKLHHCQTRRINERIHGWIEHIRRNLVAIYSRWLNAARTSG